MTDSSTKVVIFCFDSLLKLF